MDEEISATEWILMLAEALKSTHVPTTKNCNEDGCGAPIRRGKRCEACRKKRHAAFERARTAKKRRFEEGTDAA